MEIRHLKLIETVAREGNLTKAVKKLNVSPSALSHQLKEMERELGEQLFYRVNKKLVITDAGRIILRSAQVVLKELDQARRDLMAFREGQHGELRITTECYTCYHWLPGMMQTFSNEFPCVDIKIHPEYTDGSIKALLNGEVDAVITTQWDENPNIEYSELFRDEMVAVVAKGHPWEEKAFIEAEDFADQTVLIYCGPLDTVHLFRQLLIPKEIMPKKVIEMQLTEAQIEMVKTGNCVKVLAKWAVAPYLKTQPIVGIPVTQKGFRRTWYFANLKKPDKPAYYETFRNRLALMMREGD